MTSIEVEILGRKYRLRIDDPNETKDIAKEIDDRLNKLQIQYETLDLSRLLLLCVMQMQKEIFELGKQNQNLSSEQERLNQMIGKIFAES